MLCLLFLFHFLQKQCQLAVLPLGTGNDLARVLGWGSSCEDDAHLPQVLERYESASTKMLDRYESVWQNLNLLNRSLIISFSQMEHNGI